MSTPINKAARLLKAGTPLEVAEVPMPTAGPGELVIRNAAVAINTLDTHMHQLGVFVKEFPAVFGCDVAGHVYEVGHGAEKRFSVGDRVIGHTINLVTGNPQHGAFALYTVIPADKAAILPRAIPFTTGVVVPFALEAAVCALSVTTPGVALPGVPTPALGLPYPSLGPASTDKIIVISGGSSSPGSMAIQLASAAGVAVVAIASAQNEQLSRRCGASAVFDYRDADVVDKVVAEIRDSGKRFVGVFDAIATGETLPNMLAILERLGGGHLACTHPPPAEGVPENVQAGMIFAVNDAAAPVWREYVTPALETGKLQCLPEATVVGKGLDSVQVALERCAKGVSATKLVVDLSTE